jgi:hypothetical protein
VRSIYTLFGAVLGPDTALGLLGAVFGLICLLAAVFGFGKVIWTWRTASRSEQLLCVAIVAVTASYVISMLPNPKNPYEIVAVLPFGAVLASRACVPARITDASRGRATVAAGALAALLPLTAAASVATATTIAMPVAVWLEAHSLSYGIAGYWNASSVTVQSGNRGSGARGQAVGRQDRPLRLGDEDILVRRWPARCDVRGRRQQRRDW